MKESMMTTIHTINPASEEILNEYVCLRENQLVTAIEAGYCSFGYWKKTTFTHRIQIVENLSKLLIEKKTELALLIANEMGKPISFGRNEIEKCSRLCEHYVQYAEKYLQARTIRTEMKKTIVCYQPLGIIFGIMPWNYPFWQVFRFGIPALIAGNAIILKHAPITTGCGNKIAELFLMAGFPEYLIQHCVIDNDLATKVIANDKIAAVTLTGSVKTGGIVGAQAAGHIKKTVLELGGNDPYVVLRDADLDIAAQAIVKSRLNNTGQVCIAAKRIIAVNSIYDKLGDKIQHLINKYIFGDPLDENTIMGPMARADLRTGLHSQVEHSIKSGAKLIAGGAIPRHKGFYYPATLLFDVQPGMPAFDTELFGPVIAIVRAKDEKHAIDLANQSQYGLAAAIFTQDLARGEQIATEEINVGTCFVNAMVVSDPRVPFGGIKHSGYGRELSQEGILEFVNIKTISIHEVN